MAPPASPARALHDVLAQLDGLIRESVSTPYHAWVAVAGCAVESQEFARYHAEVTQLFSEVAEGLLTLPAGSQERYGKYVPAWWEVVVQPRWDWVVQGTKFIEAAPLDMLGTLADLMQIRAGSVSPPNPQGPEILRKAVTFLLAEVEEGTEPSGHCP